jgi:hypothetical protein
MPMSGYPGDMAEATLATAAEGQAMCCEVHLVTDPDDPVGTVMPWRVLRGGRTLEIALPAVGAHRPRVDVSREPQAATIMLRGQVGDLRLAKDDYQCCRQEWLLPDGGLLLVNDRAFHYPDDTWFNLQPTDAW